MNSEVKAFLHSFIVFLLCAAAYNMLVKPLLPDTVTNIIG